MMTSSTTEDIRTKVQIVLERSEEGGYTAIVPALPGCLSEGEIREEALANGQKAIEFYLEPIEDDWDFDVPPEGKMILLFLKTAA